MICMIYKFDKMGTVDNAIILLCICYAAQWTVDELSQIMVVPATVLRRKIAYWQTQVNFNQYSCVNALCVITCIYIYICIWSMFSRSSLNFSHMLNSV